MPKNTSIRHYSTTLYGRIKQEAYSKYASKNKQQRYAEEFVLTDSLCEALLVSHHEKILRHYNLGFLVSRVHFCHRLRNFIHNYRSIFDVFFSDEAWFRLSGYISVHNYRMW